MSTQQNKEWMNYDFIKTTQVVYEVFSKYCFETLWIRTVEKFVNYAFVVTKSLNSPHSVYLVDLQNKSLVRTNDMRPNKNYAMDFDTYEGTREFIAPLREAIDTRNTEFHQIPVPNWTFGGVGNES